MALIGGGIMSITLATMLKELDPALTLTIYDALDGVAKESSNPWNNAGTGHSALCEMNYTPELPDGTVEVDKAYRINESFQLSRQFWSYLVNKGTIPDPTAFISPVPHMSLVWGEKNIAFLKKRYEGLKDHPLFLGMEFSEDHDKIGTWAPLLMAGRPGPGEQGYEPMAATFVPSGTDVNFGKLTEMLADRLRKQPGVEFKMRHAVKNLRRDNGKWLITVKTAEHGKRVDVAETVFVGAGGAALTLLQKSGIKEIHGYGGFPVSGQFLRTTDPELVSQHRAKVYGKASVGAPPMSVPHLDTRVVDGNTAVLFGPYAGWTPKFLKFGSNLDLFRSIRWHNLYPMATSGLQNLGLVKYLVTGLLASKSKKLKSLQAYYPEATLDNWELITAGQRVQIIKPKAGKHTGELVLGTEVLGSSREQISGLLGASPGASTAVPIMVDVIEQLYPERFEGWLPKLREMMPSYGILLAEHPELAEKLLRETAKTLQIHN